MTGKRVSWRAMSSEPRLNATKLCDENVFQTDKHRD